MSYLHDYFGLKLSCNRKYNQWLLQGSSGGRCLCAARKTAMRRNEAVKLPCVMKLSAFDYDLPPELIAQRALPERDASRMLLLDRVTGVWQDRQFRELPDLLRGDEVIVVNAARV